ncbi:MAG: hypothetical protein CXT78_04975 [Thaumarchaeota archaeon]|jgi:hypothetical protein|nr:MAG: hypothetical protein CXT78_04975 [Nitrososphaerota archaeon]
MVEQISETIKKKLKEICKDPDGKSEEYRMIIEVLETTSGYSKVTKAPVIKKQFQHLVDQHFPYKENKNE